MELPHNFHLLVLLPLLYLAAHPKLHMVSDDIECAMEQHTQMRSHSFQSDSWKLFHHLGVVATVYRKQVYYLL